jgi:hypothetical protein
LCSTFLKLFIFLLYSTQASNITTESNHIETYITQANFIISQCSEYRYTFIGHTSLSGSGSGNTQFNNFEVRHDHHYSSDRGSVNRDVTNNNKRPREDSRERERSRSGGRNNDYILNHTQYTHSTQYNAQNCNTPNYTNNNYNTSNNNNTNNRNNDNNRSYSGSYSTSSYVTNTHNNLHYSTHNNTQNSHHNDNVSGRRNESSRDHNF